MTAGVVDPVSVLGQLLARWEVSRLAVIPTSFTMMSAAPMASGLYVASKIVGRAGLSVLLVVPAVWLILVLLEHGRAFWRLRHPYASPSWLRGLRAAVGDGIVDDALAHLAMQYTSTPGYIIRRYDMAVAIWVQRSSRREAERQGEGLRLDQVGHGT